MEEAIKEYLEINLKIKELEQRKESLKSSLILSMKENSTTEIKSEFGFAKLSMQKRNALDKAKVETFCTETGQDISFFMKETEYERLDVKANNIQEF